MPAGGYLHRRRTPDEVWWKHEAALEAAAQAEVDARAHTEACVLAARQDGVSWNRIGPALGIQPQSARMRWFRLPGMTRR